MMFYICKEFSYTVLVYIVHAPRIWKPTMLILLIEGNQKVQIVVRS